MIGSAGVLLVAADSGRVLLMRRCDDGLWSIPGGHIEPGEDEAAAAARELCEETGIVDFLELPLIDVHIQAGGYTTYVVESPGELEPFLNDEHDDWGWFDVDRGMPRPLHPGVVAAISRT